MSSSTLPPSGLLPFQTLGKLTRQGVIASSSPLEDDQIQPASLDLRLGQKAWRLRASFLPGENCSIETCLRDRDLVMHSMSLTQGSVLETGGVYLVALQESLQLPPHLEGLANPKSSTGRLDVFTRVITDGARVFDRIQHGYQGPLYAEIAPRTFSILAKTGDRLCQLRLRQGESHIKHALTLSVDLKNKERPVGFRAKRHARLVDLQGLAAHDPLDYWDPLWPRSGKLVLDPGEFYILSSRENVTISPDEAAEMAPSVLEMGEFRAHYAGFFDPGFGTGGPATASKAVLEVRARDAPFILQDGQPIARLVFEPMLERPAQLYGHRTSHYQGQGLKLSKLFKPWV